MNEISPAGLEREVAKEELAKFLAGQTLTANQIYFVNIIVDYLTEHGVMEPELLYSAPFTDITPKGPDELFTSSEIDQLVVLLDEI